MTDQPINRASPVLMRLLAVGVLFSIPAFSRPLLAEEAIVISDPSHTRKQGEWIELKEHSGSAISVAFSPDGRLLASGCTSSEVRIWNPETARLVARFNVGRPPARAVAFDPTGRYLSAGSGDGTVFTWDIRLGEQIGKARRHKQIVYCVAYSPCGRYLATGSRDGTVVIWDVQADKELRVLEWGGGTHALAASFSNDGKILALGLARKSGKSWEGTAELWDVGRGKRIGVLEGHKNAVGQVAFSPDSRWLATGSYDATAALWDTRTNRMVHRFTGPLGGLTPVAFSPDARHLATGTDHGIVAIWNARKGKAAKIIEPKKPRTYPRFYPRVQGLAFSPDGRRLAVASDCWLRLWRLPKELWPNKKPAKRQPAQPLPDH